MIKKHIRQLLILSILLSLSSLVYSQSDTYLKRETFGLIKSTGFDIQEYAPGRYLTLLDGQENLSHFQIGFLGKHEDNGISFKVDSMNFGILTQGFRPKLEVSEDLFYTYTRGIDRSYVIKYDLTNDSTSIFWSLAENDLVSQFRDICVVDEDEVLALRFENVENSFRSKGQIFWIKDGQLSKIIPLDYPDTLTSVSPLRLLYNDVSETVFVMNSITESHDNVTFHRTYIQEYAYTGEVVWDYITPVQDFHSFGSTTFLIDGSTDYLYLFGKGGTDLVGWIMKVEKATGSILWERQITEPDLETGNKQCNTWHIQFDGDGESLLIGGGFFSNDQYRQSSGFMGKVSLDGDILWIRTFVVDIGTSAEAFIRSVRPTLDGGYIAIGDSDERFGNTEIAFATMIVKTDSEGLVSGYNLPSSTKAIEDESLSLFTYHPSPASTRLTITHKYHRLCQYRITDNLGRYQGHFSLELDGESHQLDVTGYTPGSYIITVSDGRQILRSELFLVE